MKRVVLERLAMVQGVQYTLLAVASDGTDHTQVMVKQGNHLIASLPYQNRAPDEALDMVLDDLDLIVRRLPLSCESRLPVYLCWQWGKDGGCNEKTRGCNEKTN